MPAESLVSPTLVAWGNAWLLGHVTFDEVIDQVRSVAGPTMVDDAPITARLVDLRLTQGLREVRLALPAPGDPLGLSGPPEFNAAALDAGQGVICVLADRNVGLVPAPDLRGSSYEGTAFTTYPAGAVRADLPSLSEAERDLTDAMRAATEALSGVEGPGQAHPGRLEAGGELAPGYPARAHRVSVLAARLSLIVRLADEDVGLTSGQMATRAEALRQLDRAIRRAIVAAHHAIFEPLRSQ
ncbi:hypothetical protein [Nonomuraea typhae]|uniref:hypothetical protein n=1 Tax=Nonomuraea typhae TaxID=2603600 RepID=UPI0012FC22B2|nr:hypothetical protein [Nonomuraea typhae]